MLPHTPSPDPAILAEVRASNLPRLLATVKVVQDAIKRTEK